MDWSLILPTRERPALLEGMLQSVKETALDIASVEVHVAVDDDDAETWKVVNSFASRFPFATFHCLPRQENFSEGYYNYMARLSKGRYIQALNDDVRFATPEWDRIGVTVLDRYLERWKDGVVYGDCDDDWDRSYCCFPILSRQAIEKLGYFFCPKMSAWGADIHLYRIYAGVYRVVPVPYRVEHLSHHTGKRERDHVNIRMAAISQYAHDTASIECARLMDALEA